MNCQPLVWFVQLNVTWTFYNLDMLDVTVDLRRDVGLEVPEQHLADDGLDLHELGRKVSERDDALQVSSQDVARRRDQVECT